MPTKANHRYEQMLGEIMKILVGTCQTMINLALCEKDYFSEAEFLKVKTFPFLLSEYIVFILSEEKYKQNCVRHEPHCFRTTFCFSTIE